jgi:hypothetical protein
LVWNVMLAAEVCRRQRRVPAQCHLDLRRQPPQLELLPLLPNEERGLGQVHLLRDAP